MSGQPKSPNKEDRLKSALRDNLKKRKAQAKKLKGEGEDAAVKLRDRSLDRKSD